MVIPAGNPSQWTGPTGTNTYVLPGRTATLIDAGIGNAAHVDAVASALDGQSLDAVLLTHSHSDHASGVPALIARWPRLEIRPSTRALVDGESIHAGDGSLIALHTPGHAPDHFCFVDAERREVFCGDLARTGGTIVIPATRGGDLRAYLASLRRIRELRPRRLWPGHGPAIQEPDALIAQYLAHREQREAQIVDAMRRGLCTLPEIVPDVYRGLPQTLVAAAAESVLAHLQKLEEDGVAEIVNERYTLVS